jgi:hypothetical protein
MSEEHLMVPSMSVCHILPKNYAIPTIQGHCWSTLLQKCEPGILLAYNVAQMTLDHVTATITSTLIMWSEEHLWNFSDSKEYPFPILLLNAGSILDSALYKLKCVHLYKLLSILNKTKTIRYDLH